MHNLIIAQAWKQYFVKIMIVFGDIHDYAFCFAKKMFLTFNALNFSRCFKLFKASTLF